MKKKKVFIISHAHWDREWYMGFEEHHMRLVKLIDDLLYLFKNDPKFDSFHLDGQDVILDDYLSVRPEKRNEIIKWVKKGKLRVGPFYILQDDFLISPEANVRNTQYGIKKAYNYGHTPVPVGYFPDTFGNMGQAPQLMKLAGLDTVAFGRGVTPTGFNNQVGQGKFDSTYSEMWWQSPNKDKILGILFANWYSNGNEIPVDEDEAKKYWTKKLAEAEKFASTPDLLFMNGVDHQPVQMDVTKAIEVANKLFPDYEFIHSNFEDYIKQLKKDLPNNLSTISGELTSQDTDGWYTLANCASSRIYMKQKNTKMERLLEDQVEPIYLLNKNITQSDQDRLDYAWHELLRNDPHDSISGSGVDEVHRGMMNRYEKVNQVGNYLTDKGLIKFAKKINSSSLPKDSKPFLVINTSGVTKNNEVEMTVELSRALFAGTTPEKAYQECQMFLKNHPNYKLFTQDGTELPFRIIKKYVRFGYDLPERKFRVPYMAAYLKIAFTPVIRPFSWDTFYVQESSKDSSNKSKVDWERFIENKALRVEVEESGQIQVFDSAGKLRSQFNLIDTGDIGNEYIYKQSADGKEIIFNSKIRNVKRESIVNGQKLSFEQTMMLPESADKKLKKEQEEVIDITHRTARRSNNLKEFSIKVTLTLMDHDDHVNIKVEGNNQIKDHRLRARFSTLVTSTTHESDSIFEVVKRNNQVSKNWKNPENPQHEQAFVSVHDQSKGIVIGNFGLNEYEVRPDGSQVDITLLRCVGEMGDWGYFPTEDSQCQGKFKANLSIQLTNSKKTEQLMAYKTAKANQIDLITKQINLQNGTENMSKQFLKVTNPAFQVTAMRVTPEGKFLVRGYNLTDDDQKLDITLFGKKPQKIVNLLDEKLSLDVDSNLKPAEIRTYEFN